MCFVETVTARVTSCHVMSRYGIFFSSEIANDKLAGITRSERMIWTSGALELDVG